MEHYLHMCQLMRNTRSQLQSSTRLLAATKARASPNQLNNFNVSAESPSLLPHHPHICTTPPPPINVWTPKLRLHPPPLYVSIVLLSLAPALSTTVILTHLSTRSVVLAIQFIITWRNAAVIGLKIVKTNILVPTLPKLPCLFWYKNFNWLGYAPYYPPYIMWWSTWPATCFNHWPLQR